MLQTLPTPGIGFNCGSTLGITQQKWLVATRAAATTINSTAGGGVAALLYTEIKSRGALITAPDVATGILASLVAITPACACTNPHEALLIGFVAGGLALAVNDVLASSWCRIDDPVGALGVHAASAIWGLICVGLFADSSLPGIDVKDGLFKGGGFELLGLQLLGIVVVIAWGVALVTPFFYLVGAILGGNWRDPRFGLRVSEESELEGIDHSVHRSMRSLGCMNKPDEGVAADDSLAANSSHVPVKKTGRPTLADYHGYNLERSRNNKEPRSESDENEFTDGITERPEGSARLDIEEEWNDV